ncbi:MAG: AI-2E family transporter [Phycisphaerae bacterium]|nr:AI-2E family transporter [Tepidisphaeraceae bacterium]
MGTQNTRWVALLTTMAIVLYLCWLMIQPFVDVLLWSTVLAIIAYPANLRLRRRGYSPPVSAALTTVLVVLVILIPLTLVTTAVVRQAGDAARMVYHGFHEVLGPESRLLDWMAQYVDVGPLRDPKAIAERVGQFSGAVASRTLGLLGGILGAVVQIFFVLFTLYYLLRDSDSVVPAVRGMLPLKSDQADTVFRRTHEVITASVNGVLLIAGIQGLLGMIGFMICGLPSPVLWGVVMFVLSTIPMAGAAIVWVPAAIFLAATGKWGYAIFLAAWGGLVIGLIDNLLRPRLVGQRARLHELLIFFAVLGGLQVFGVLGLFVGPVVVAIALAMVEVFRQANLADDARVELGNGVIVAPAADVLAVPPSSPQVAGVVAAVEAATGAGEPPTATTPSAAAPQTP